MASQTMKQLPTLPWYWKHRRYALKSFRPEGPLASLPSRMERIVQQMEKRKVEYIVRDQGTQKLRGPVMSYHLLI